MKCQKCKAPMFWQSTNEQWFCLGCRNAFKPERPQLNIRKKRSRVIKEMTMIVQLSKELGDRLEEGAILQPIPKSLRSRILADMPTVLDKSPTPPEKIGRCLKGHTTFYQQRHDRFYCLTCRCAVEFNSRND